MTIVNGQAGKARSHFARLQDESWTLVTTNFFGKEKERTLGEALDLLEKGDRVSAVKRYKTNDVGSDLFYTVTCTQGPWDNLDDVVATSEASGTNPTQKKIEY